jgi:hypothetical protein
MPPASSGSIDDAGGGIATKRRSSPSRSTSALRHPLPMIDAPARPFVNLWQLQSWYVVDDARFSPSNALRSHATFFGGVPREQQRTAHFPASSLAINIKQRARSR